MNDANTQEAISLSLFETGQDPKSRGRDGASKDRSFLGLLLWVGVLGRLFRAHTELGVVLVLQ